MSEKSVAYVRTEMAPELPAPDNTHGPIAWMKHNLFSSIPNTILTLIGIYLIYWLSWPLLKFSFYDVAWTGDGREACTDKTGACWAYVRAYFSQFVYGRYPVSEYWRVDIVFAVGALGLIPALIPSAPYKRFNILFMLIAYPVMTFILLSGGNLAFEDYLLEYGILFAIIVALGVGISVATKSDPKPVALTLGGIGIAIAIICGVMSFDFGLAHVETDRWGGFLVTLVIAVTGIAASLPLGIALALGRRSNMPIIRVVSVIFIEFWRGVPLITVLFMSSVVLPLFLPEGVTFDKLLRALIGVALFSAAYMAEVVRGGLQAIPKGQYEGASALGLTYWQSTGLIIMPQALKLVIPGIVNTFIGLFKDTTLVLIIGLFDLLGQVQFSFTDSKWATPNTSHTGYLFAAIVFWIFCFGMSRYSIFMENRLHTGHKR
ncbi:amino acid ABC transporter permease [Cohaesibacter gelatinilyticus]|uniref:Amino acid ABC transporter membrane protein 2, PAAT family n=1 Tax=Cohaesibacter gelatinilyticus TaxID=372072 RepID=A0A285NI09_9HYPH|nr:amino acid ABC transporter permease [Cohaesibacter gelatinilyticus]SNZ07506.1 amino acid ABC transporter membrane protein 2, PAAT family [Cohaesibacter gelatinilyticus]HAT86776.1 amino acid ABC transporter permease [Hyphomicrobiales bacterium]